MIISIVKSKDLPNEYRVEALQCVMLMMPDENREVLMTLLGFLSDVATSSDLNQVRPHSSIH